jgi:hypothetical protein
MGTRITDFITQLCATMVAAFRKWSRVEYGLPITITNSIACPVSSTTQLSVTVPVDCWVRGVYPEIVDPAAPATMQNDMFVSSVTIAGFTLLDCQATIQPIFASVYPNTPQTPLNKLGFPNGFKLRQGDVITISYVNQDAANPGRGSVFVDAYRCDQLRPPG